MKGITTKKIKEKAILVGVISNYQSEEEVKARRAELQGQLEELNQQVEAAIARSSADRQTGQGEAEA